jgi:cell wall-associated NlpC family hydrolase
VIDAVVGDVVLYKTERGDPSHVALIVEKYTITLIASG